MYPAVDLQHFAAQHSLEKRNIRLLIEVVKTEAERRKGSLSARQMPSGDKALRTPPCSFVEHTTDDRFLITTVFAERGAARQSNAREVSIIIPIDVQAQEGHTKLVLTIHRPDNEI